MRARRLIFPALVLLTGLFGWAELQGGSSHRARLRISLAEIRGQEPALSPATLESLEKSSQQILDRNRRLEGTLGTVSAICFFLGLGGLGSVLGMPRLGTEPESRADA